MKRCKAGGNECEVTQSAKSCIHCRYTKCLNIGMRPELVRGKRKKDESRDLEREEREDSESENSDTVDASEECATSTSNQAEGLLAIIIFPNIISDYF